MIAASSGVGLPAPVWLYRNRRPPIGAHDATRVSGSRIASAEAGSGGHLACGRQIWARLRSWSPWSSSAVRYVSTGHCVARA
eukprot:584880-Rhodomonas_salina.1